MAEKEIKKERNSTSSTDKPKVAKVVALRNRFFYMLYRYTTLVFVTSLVCMIFSIGFLLFFARQPVPPQYIPINEDGTYIKLAPLSECKEDREVQKFVATAINKLYKYDYVNYSDQLLAAAGYFTTTGFNEFLTEFKNSGTLLAVKENKWVVTVMPDGVPQITKRGKENDICTWDLKTPISIMFIGNNSLNPKGDLYVRVTRTSVINNPEGLGIQKVVFTEGK